MRIEALALEGALLLHPEPRGDERGSFARLWCARETGLDIPWVQVNLSESRLRGTLRGLHLQAAPHAEWKLVRCLRGAIHDVIVDLRPESPTCGRWVGVDLRAADAPSPSLLVPAGFGHGFITLEDDTAVSYLVSAFYEPSAERGLRWDDPAIGIRWPLEPTVLSDKDRAWPDWPGWPPKAAP